MGETIISPWVFYLADISESVKYLLLLIGIAALVGAFFWFMMTINDSLFEDSHMFSKRVIAASLLAIAIGAVLPSKEACYQMLIANYATYENVEAAGGQVTEVVDYIFEKFDEAKTDNAD